ncbi:DUF5403 family protein [Amycolatopsis lexingtonensis]|uniref:DUF5403 family protein n=1 Tax=Amycolatopsis lexingtonensis TaxID=218822 RepID=UPI003F71CEF9
MAYVYSDRTVNRIVSHIPGVKAEVAEAALEIGVRAETKLLRHQKTGSHRIEVEQGRTDSFVWLVGPAALSVEFGHWVYNDDEQVEPLGYAEGLYIITEAAGLI